MNNEYFLAFSKILETSIKKHDSADQPITAGHLSNMIKMAIKMVDRKETDEEKMRQDAADEVFYDQHKYGTD